MNYLLCRHRESGKIRVLMRQEKTMKVIANHFLDPRITITPHAGSDKSFVWNAFDFSDYELVERVSILKQQLLLYYNCTILNFNSQYNHDNEESIFMYCTVYLFRHLQFALAALKSPRNLRRHSQNIKLK